METVEDIRHTSGNKEIYARRKETIERIFGTAKEQHGSRYTQYVGKARMEMKAGLTFACMDLKKLARILAKKESGGLPFQEHPYILKKIYLDITVVVLIIYVLILLKKPLFCHRPFIRQQWQDAVREQSMGDRRRPVSCVHDDHLWRVSFYLII